MKNIQNITLKSALLSVLIIYLQFSQLQFSVHDYIARLFDLKIPFLIFDLLIILAADLLFFLIARRWSAALGIHCVICAVFGVANYHVTEYHGYPLFPSVMANTGAALNVMSGYRPIIDARFWAILILTLAEFRLIALLRAWEKNNPSETELKSKPGYQSPKKRILTLAALIFDIFIIIIIMFFGIRGTLVTLSAEKAITQYGFPACFLDDLKCVLYPRQMPEGYNTRAINDILSGFESNSGDGNHQDHFTGENNNNNNINPDIILILNETFCDLDVYADVMPDRDYMSAFYHIPGAVYGYAITPGIGGGTNNAEFELLTGNSMALLKRTSPFNYINFQKSSLNLARYFKQFGYQTAAMHNRDGSNYNRNRAYPAMGFDTILLGPEHFPDAGANGNRVGLDSHDYDYLIRQYENMPSDSPRLIYLLTYQNHGGWGQNPDEFDTVHTKNHFGDLTDDVNEYLSTVALSCQAFVELTDYFAQSERPVIILMTGDHAPSFISNLPGKRAYDELTEQIIKRTVPYVIYRNYQDNHHQDNLPEYINTFMFAPLVVRLAGLELTDYYQAILNAQAAFPVFTSNYIRMDTNGDLSFYHPSDPYNDPITKYLYLEYNALIAGDDYQEKYYLPDYQK